MLAYDPRAEFEARSFRLLTCLIEGQNPAVLHPVAKLSLCANLAAGKEASPDPDSQPGLILRH